MHTKRTGFYDSGLGGLSVLKTIHSQFPYHEYHYLADTLYLPYGERSHTELTARISAIHQFLIHTHKVDLLIVGCNTASTYEITSQAQSTPIYNVIEPTIKETLRVAKQYNKNRIGILATSKTIESHIYPRYLKEAEPNLHIFQTAAPLLSDFIENEGQHKLEFKKQLQSYLDTLTKNQIDILIPACTHYLLILEEMRSLLPPHIHIIDMRQACMNDVRSELHTSSQSKQNQPIQVYYTKPSSRFEKITRQIIQNEVHFHHIKLS